MLLPRSEERDARRSALLCRAFSLSRHIYAEHERARARGAVFVTSLPPCCRRRSPRLRHLHCRAPALRAARAVERAMILI